MASLLDRINVSGVLAWILWRSIYWSKLPGFTRKMKVGIAWLLDVIFPVETVQLNLGGTQGISQLHYEPGDVVFRQGDVGDALYIILEGEADVLLEKSGGPSQLLATLGAGDYFGEQALLNQRTRAATVRCRTPLNVLSKPDFTARKYTNMTAKSTNWVPLVLFVIAFAAMFLPDVALAGTADKRPNGENEPPVNPFLADSPWPMSHRNPYNQASSSYAGPAGANDAQPEFLPGEPVPITLAVSGRYPDGRRAIWGTTMKDVFKIDAHGERMQYAARFPRLQSKEDAISGAYCLVDKDRVCFVPRGPKIESFRDAILGELDSPIEMARDFTIPDNLRNSADDPIVGINLTYDGRIIFLTQRGLVGSLSRRLDDFTWLQVGEPEEEVSNSIAVDETGGIFIVTNRNVKRVQWDAADSQRLRLSWSVPYRTNDVRENGRLGTGSGTTPTLVGVGQQDKFVAIGDGQSLMHLVLLWRDEVPADWTGLPGRDRRIAAEVPVTFGDPDARRSTTEQSLTVRGYGIVTVSNLYGELGPWMRQMARRRMGNDIHNVTIYRSNRPEIAPYGIEKFCWNPETRQLESVWANRALSCPNGIPTMSAATGLFYCIGQRDSAWTLEAVDWNTGQSVFHQILPRGSKSNSFYAATEIGDDGNILTGTYGGVLRFRRKSTVNADVSEGGLGANSSQSVSLGP